MHILLCAGHYSCLCVPYTVMYFFFYVCLSFWCWSHFSIYNEVVSNNHFFIVYFPKRHLAREAQLQQYKVSFTSPQNILSPKKFFVQILFSWGHPLVRCLLFRYKNLHSPALGQHKHHLYIVCRSTSSMKLNSRVKLLSPLLMYCQFLSSL